MTYSGVAYSVPLHSVTLPHCPHQNVFHFSNSWCKIITTAGKKELLTIHIKSIILVLKLASCMFFHDKMFVKRETKSKGSMWGISLAVQCLRLFAPNAPGGGYQTWSGNQISHAAIKDPTLPPPLEWVVTTMGVIIEEDLILFGRGMEFMLVKVLQRS